MDDPEDVQGLCDRAWNLLNEGNADLAIFPLLKVNTIDTNIPLAHSLLGGIYHERAEFDLAIREYQELLRCYMALGSHRMTLLARSVLGHSLVLADRLPEAQEQFDLATALLRDDTDPYVVRRLNSLSEALRRCSEN